MLSVLLDIPMVLEFNSSEVWWARKMENEFLLFILRAAEKTVLACSDWIATVSKVLNRELVTHGIDADRVFDNPNGVDPEIFHTAPGNRGPGDLVVVGFTGIFAKHHGIDILIEGFNRSCPQENHLHLLLIGGGRLTDWVRGLVVEKGLMPHVTITGMIPHHQVRDHLKHCDMLVLPHPKMGDGSDFFGSPVKLFEYMMSGRAILSTNVGQMGKILRDRSTALLVGSEDPGEISRGITELSSDTTLRIKMGKRARRLALQRYTWEDNVRRVLDRICRGEL
jgi:glycosyltransferase involved in cell wall biosynthesis